VNALLALSRAIDAFTERVGRVVYWLVLVVVLISAANATVRKLFNYSSNAYLEIQWYLFSVIFLFGAGYTLLRNDHVRIDIIQGRLSPRAQNWIDVVGIVLFLMPMSPNRMPTAPSENATGKPISSVMMSAPNIIGAMLAISHAVMAAPSRTSPQS
jgi:TRAP-type mannitol/chloroaromatic compound transport system permease small subunit